MVTHKQGEALAERLNMVPAAKRREGVQPIRHWRWCAEVAIIIMGRGIGVDSATQTIETKMSEVQHPALPGNHVEQVFLITGWTLFDNGQVAERAMDRFPPPHLTPRPMPLDFSCEAHQRR
ncbi:hypothetical protein Pelo_18132 [Pelomyxa schiedti]|nr:hypothetical protein Pelo_18132 [Pelomyxa schiedti]